MRYRTFEVSGVEVLRPWARHSHNPVWPQEHWRKHKGRWRLFVPAVDDHVGAALSGLDFGGGAQGFVFVLEIADFAVWAPSPFAADGARHRYMSKACELVCRGKLDWTAVQQLTLSQQYEAYASCVLEAVVRMRDEARRPRGFDIEAFFNALADALAAGKPSMFAGEKARAGL